MASRATKSNGEGQTIAPEYLQGNGIVPSGGTARPDPQSDPTARGVADSSAGSQNGANPHPPTGILPVIPVLSLQQRAASLREGMRPPGGEFAECHPLLYEAMCPAKDKKGRIIEGLGCNFSGAGDAWILYARWPLGGIQTSVAIADPLSLWLTLEGLVTGTIKSPWKEMRRVPRHLKRDVEPG